MITVVSYCTGLICYDICFDEQIQIDTVDIRYEMTVLSYLTVDCLCCDVFTMNMQNLPQTIKPVIWIYTK